MYSAEDPPVSGSIKFLKRRPPSRLWTMWTSRPAWSASRTSHAFNSSYSPSRDLVAEGAAGNRFSRPTSTRTRATFGPSEVLAEAGSNGGRYFVIVLRQSMRAAIPQSRQRPRSRLRRTLVIRGRSHEQKEMQVSQSRLGLAILEIAIAGWRARWAMSASFG